MSIEIISFAIYVVGAVIIMGLGVVLCLDQPRIPEHPSPLSPFLIVAALWPLVLFVLLVMAVVEGVTWGYRKLAGQPKL